MRNKILHYGLLVWFVAALFYAIEFFQRVAPTILAEPITAAFAITPATLGLIMSLYYYVYGAAQIPVGLLMDRYKARWMLGSAAVIVSAGTLLFSYANFVWALALGRILIGLGSAFGFIGCLKLARDWFPARFFALIVGLTNTIGVAGALFGEEPLARLQQQIGWRNSLLITVVAGFIIAILIFIFVRQNKTVALRDTEQQFSVTHSLKILLSSQQAWLIAIYAGLMVAPVIAFAELWSVNYFEATQNISQIIAAKVNSFIFIGIAIGGPVNGWVSGVFKKRKLVMAYGNVATLLLFVLIILIPTINIHLLELIMLLLGFFVSSMLVSFPLNIENHPKQMSATIIGWTNMFIPIIGALFQPLIGFLLQKIGHITALTAASSYDFHHAILILPIALALNLVILYFIRETYCQSHA